MRGRRSGRIKLQPTQFIVSMQVIPIMPEGAGGSSAVFSIPVQRNGNMGYGGSVDWAVTPSGASPATLADFGGAFPSGTLTFGANDLLREIDITIYGNDDADGDRTFTVTLSNVTTDGGSGMAMIAIPSVICTIVDDDTAGGGGGATYEGNDAIYRNDPTTYGET